MATERILVVDDEEPIREIVTAMLHSSGYQCQQAASGKQALALLTSGDSFELVLSDLMMADMDGIGLLERTKEKYPDMRSLWSRLCTIFPWPWRRFATALTTIF